MSSFNYSVLDPETYADRLYQTIKSVEGYSLTPYRIPGEDFDTLGLGFAYKKTPLFGFGCKRMEEQLTLISKMKRK